MTRQKYNKLRTRFKKNYPKKHVKIPHIFRPKKNYVKQPLPIANTIGSLRRRAYYAFWDPMLGGVPPAQRPGEKYLVTPSGLVNEYEFHRNMKKKLNNEFRRRVLEPQLHNVAATRIQRAWRRASEAKNRENMRAIKTLLGNNTTGRYTQLIKNLSNYTLSNNVREALNQYRRTGTVHL